MYETGCCAPGRGAGPPASVTRAARSGSAHSIEQRSVPAQTFLMGDQQGDDRYGDGETPVHEVTLPARPATRPGRSPGRRG